MARKYKLKPKTVMLREVDKLYACTNKVMSAYHLLRRDFSGKNLDALDRAIKALEFADVSFANALADWEEDESNNGR